VTQIALPLFPPERREEEDHRLSLYTLVFSATNLAEREALKSASLEEYIKATIMF